MQDLSPKDLAQKTADDIAKNLEPDKTAGVLDALQLHYEVLNKTQQMQIDFLSEFIKNLKTLQNKDKESLDKLKQQVLSQVLQNQSN